MTTRSCRTKFCRLSTRLLPTLLAVLAVGGLLFGAQPASAQTCINDVWKAHGNNQNLTCTANDVTLSSATNIDIITGGSCAIENGVRVCRCFAGGPVTFTADFQMDLTADTRYDVGFYLATSPGATQALTGQCTATASLESNTVNFINLDTGADVCGDITGPGGLPSNTATDNNPLFVTSQVTAQCPATGQLQLPFCTTWRQPGSNQVCLGTGNGTTTNDVFPGSPSKCNCGTLVVPILAETPNITVTKAAMTPSVPETGGSATYGVTLTNNGLVPVTVTSLTDNQYGDITTVHAAGGGFQAVTATTCVPDGNTATCEVGGSIAGGAQCSCTFTGTVPPGDFPGSFTDVVQGCANNISNPTPSCDTDDATVPYTDVQQPPTLIKTALATSCRIDQTYSVVVTNTSAQDTLTLSALNDDVYGNITAAAGASCTGTCIVSTTCGLGGIGNPGTLPAVIAASGNYSCSFVGRSSSCNATVHDTVTGTATDDDGQSYTPSDDATVVITVTKP
jgi:hypothetical protein